MGFLNLLHLRLADGRVGLNEPEAQGGLTEILGGKHKQQRVRAQLHAVSLLHHTGILVLEGSDVPFEGAQLGVRATHGPFK